MSLDALTLAELDAEVERRQADARAAELRRAAPAVQRALYDRIMEAVAEYRLRVQRGEGVPS